MRTSTGFAALAAIFLAAPLSAQRADYGRIYVYAQRLTAARAWLPISCGGVLVAELKQGMFFAIDVPSGRHSLGVETGVPTVIDIHSGEEAFVRLDWNYQIGRRPLPVLGPVRPDRARKEMMYLRYVDAKKVLSPSVPKTDPREPAELRLKRRSEQ